MTELVNPNIRVYFGPNPHDPRCEQIREWLLVNHIEFSDICAVHFGELHEEATAANRYGNRATEGVPAVFLCDDETVLLAACLPAPEFLMMIGKMYLGMEPKAPPKITLH